MAISDRVVKAWNAFRSNEKVNDDYTYGGGGGGVSYTTASPSRPRLRYFNERSIVSAIYNRISIDVAGISFRHIKLDDFGRYLEDVPSSLNSCLTLEANLDQSPRAFRQDIAMTLFDKGVGALVPVDTAVNPTTNEVFDIYTLRVGEIIASYPKNVRVSVYNEEKGV